MESGRFDRTACRNFGPPHLHYANLSRNGKRLPIRSPLRSPDFPQPAREDHQFLTGILGNSPRTIAGNPVAKKRISLPEVSSDSRSDDACTPLVQFLLSQNGSPRLEIIFCNRVREGQNLLTTELLGGNFPRRTPPRRDSVDGAGCSRREDWLTIPGCRVHLSAAPMSLLGFEESFPDSGPRKGY